jgi:hypothetical protein
MCFDVAIDAMSAWITFDSNSSMIRTEQSLKRFVLMSLAA